MKHGRISIVLSIFAVTFGIASMTATVHADVVKDCKSDTKKNCDNVCINLSREISKAEKSNRDATIKLRSGPTKENEKAAENARKFYKKKTGKTYKFIDKPPPPLTRAVTGCLKKDDECRKTLTYKSCAKEKIKVK